MPLTFRVNGTTASNLINASWFNDYHDLLTGVMQDQPVTIKNDIILQPFGSDPTVAPGGSRVSGTNLGIGTYKYVYTFVNQGGESLPSPVFSITTTSGNQKVNLTGIATGATPGTTARNIYRTKVNSSTFLLCTTLNDNSTTTFTDTVADGSLGAAAPITSTYGGSCIVSDTTGSTTKALLSKDGTLSLNPSTISVTGNTSGTATIWEPERGSFHRLVVQTNNFRNSGASEQIVYLPSMFTQFLQFFAVNNPPFQFRSGNGGSALNSEVFTNLAMNGGAVNGQAVINTNSFGYCQSTADQISFAVDGGSSGHTGMILIEGI